MSKSHHKQAFNERINKQISRLKNNFDNNKVNRKLLVKYTLNDRDVSAMNDSEFLDYASFLLDQQDVHKTEKAREAYNIAKNFKKIRTFKDFLKAISAILVVLLMIAIAVLFVTAIIYLMVYFRKDKIKSVIDFVLFGTALAFVTIFIVFLFLFLKMSGTVKKIMTLM
jgi:ABC-type sugar transport system permease subunit